MHANEPALADRWEAKYGGKDRRKARGLAKMAYSGKERRARSAK